MDPLTPSSRKFLDEASRMKKYNYQTPVVKSNNNNDGSSGPDLLSPRRSMIKALNEISSSKPQHSHASVRSVDYNTTKSLLFDTPSSTSLRHDTTSSTPGYDHHHHHHSIINHPPENPQHIGFGMDIRLNFNSHNHHHLRMFNNNATTQGTTTTTTNQKENIQVRADGNGVDGDASQSFRFVNPTNRQDTNVIEYGDVVTLASCDCNGRLVSVKPGSTAIVAHRASIVSNSDRWKIEYVRGGPHEEEKKNNARSRVVCQGDSILLRSHYGALLSLVQGQLECRSEDSAGVAGSWGLSKTCVPPTAKFNSSRLYLNGQHLLFPCASSKERNQTTTTSTTRALSNFPPSVQEQVIVDELLYAMMGIEGQYIRIAAQAAPSLARVCFGIDPSAMDPALASLVTKMLPLCDTYVNLRHFVEIKSQYEHGQVAHAFTAEIHHLIKEYLVVIAQLETLMKSGTLSLQKCWFYLQPSLRTLSVLCKLTDACRELSGGALLSEIHQAQERCRGTKDQALFQDLLSKACVPYFGTCGVLTIVSSCCEYSDIEIICEYSDVHIQIFMFSHNYSDANISMMYLEMLTSWIRRGKVSDPYQEFFVREDLSFDKRQLGVDPWCRYWDKRYTLRHVQVPSFFSTDLAMKILTTGKYLNVLHQTLKHTKPSSLNPHPLGVQQLEYDMMSEIEPVVDQAHEYASKLVLELVLESHDLLPRLKSLKHYFLLDRGDFFVEFMDIAKSELADPVTKLSVSRLETLLQLAIASSSCLNDPYRDDLGCVLSPVDLITQMEMIHQRSTKGVHDPLTANHHSNPQVKTPSTFSSKVRVANSFRHGWIYFISRYIIQTL